MALVQATNTNARVPPQVVDEVCQSCRKCVARQSCKTKALLQMDPGEAPVVDGARCFGCYKCVPACPFGAIVAHIDLLPTLSSPPAPSPLRKSERGGG